ncbi:MAG: hypothetical protein ACP5P4_16280 [Steroidobacteraceae bacterium]
MIIYENDARRRRAQGRFWAVHRETTVRSCRKIVAVCSATADPYRPLWAERLRTRRFGETAATFADAPTLRVPARDMNAYEVTSGRKRRAGAGASDDQIRSGRPFSEQRRDALEPGGSSCTALDRLAALSARIASRIARAVPLSIQRVAIASVSRHTMVAVARIASAMPLATAPSPRRTTGNTPRQRWPSCALASGGCNSTPDRRTPKFPTLRAVEKSKAQRTVERRATLTRPSTAAQGFAQYVRYRANHPKTLL